MIYSVLLDFGGTLDADGWHWLDRFYSIYPEIGFKDLPKEQIKEAFYWADAQADQDTRLRTSRFRPMVEHHVHWQFQKLGFHNTDLERQAVAAFSDPSETILRRNHGLLKRLHQAGLRLGIVSNNYGNMETLCREFGYNEYVGAIIDSAVVGLRKPDPKIFELALEKLGVSAAQAAFVGDSYERDIQPAKALGMRTFWIGGPARTTLRPAADADVLLRSLEDLPEALGLPVASSAHR